MSLEKCTGRAAGLRTEAAVYRTARQLKAANAGVRVLFYWSLTQAGIGCYAANATLAAHPEWLLRNDTGAVVRPPRVDLTVAAAAEWWLSVPMDAARGWAPGVIDGVLADGAGYDKVPGVSAARNAAQYAAKRGLLARLQAAFDAPGAGLAARGGGLVLANGLSEYDQDPADPHNRGLARSGARGVMNEHFAVFEQLNHTTGAVNATKASDALDNIAWAAAQRDAQGRPTLVFCSFWPGPVVAVGKGGWPAWPGGAQPAAGDMAAWKKALADNLPWALAAYLTVAETNTFMTYAAWYELHQGFVTCPDDPGSCAAPAGYYPALKRALGAPAAPRRRLGGGGYRWTRRFEHARVAFDLLDRNATAITWLQT